MATNLDTPVALPGEPAERTLAQHPSGAFGSVITDCPAPFGFKLATARNFARAVNATQASRAFPAPTRGLAPPSNRGCLSSQMPEPDGML